MFIDLCFPKNNEHSFIEVAKKLNTDGLCFVFEKKNKHTKKDSELLLFDAVLNNIGNKNEMFSKSIKINSTKVLVFSLNQKKTNFHQPLTGITQVHIKQIKEKGDVVCFSLLKLKSILKQPYFFEKTKFVIRLLNKYKVNYFISSCAESPYGLKSKKELFCVAELFKMDPVLALSCLYDVLK